jgi:hypothetical protein
VTDAACNELLMNELHTSSFALVVQFVKSARPAFAVTIAHDAESLTRRRDATNA